MMSQITEKLFKQKPVTLMNKVTLKIPKTKPTGLRYHALNLKTLQIIAINDRSFASNPALSFQLEHIILLTDNLDKRSIISYASYKSKKRAIGS